MSSAPSAHEIWSNAHWLAQALDPRAGLVRFVEMSPVSYRDASFLDDRIMEPGRNAHLLKWPEVEQSRPPDARSDARWIFHIGHVGSTLISRLLGELDSVLAVREPRALRDLTFFSPDVRAEFIPAIRALMSRTFGRDQAAVVKATSMVGQIAGELIEQDGRGLCLFAAPEVYIRTILAGDQSPGELNTLATYYAQRAQSQGIPVEGARESPAHVAALVWACEMAALERVMEVVPEGSIRWCDFDAFLERPAPSLGEIVDFFELAADSEQVTQIATGPLMNRYSKALDHEFGPETRRALLTETARKHAPVIARALAMLSQAAEKSHLLARALYRSTPDR